ncbi:Adhesion G protein-coupled receptor E2 like protein [Argiope bruennichi]|uniref:Adhesion G protein-coupled receptor E2 like protein n=1 Tax=Argiope bruennichi TaxID=94029 RepID=A0A8T0ESK3_ARGBR|nr:Adhesion G protein-coupled receptor E2 like protein [Argiope bruennichi]
MTEESSATQLACRVCFFSTGVVVLVFCASICIISAKENVKLVYEPKFANYISANKIVNKELQSNGFELEVAQAYDRLKPVYLLPQENPEEKLATPTCVKITTASQPAKIQTKETVSQPDLKPALRQSRTECNCGFGGVCDFSFRGEKICHCEEGYYEREGYCLPCNCFGYRDVDTKCEVIDNVKHCLCPEGFHDVLGYCEDINECETNNTCHPSTICYNTFGSFYCQCPDGYEGSLDTKAVPGEVCEDIDECRSHDSCKYYDHVKCVNFPGSYKCECFQGYKPSSYSLDPSKTTCVKAKKSFVPALIVLVVTIVLIAMSIIAHFYVKRRAASLS